MKLLLARTILLLILTLAIHGDYAYADQSAKIADLENQYFAALEKQDEKAMDLLLDDEFLISSMSSNWSMNKEDFLKTIPKQVIKSQEITDIEVKVEEDKAYSKVDISMTKTFEGKDHSGDYEVYSLWEEKDGSWKLMQRRIQFLKPPE